MTRPRALTFPLAAILLVCWSASMPQRPWAGPVDGGPAAGAPADSLGADHLDPGAADDLRDRDEGARAEPRRDPRELEDRPPSGTARAHRLCDDPAPAWIWCDDFEDDRIGRYFEYDDAGGSFVRERGAGVGGSWGMRATFREGQVDAGSLKLAFGATPQPYMKPVDAGERHYREIYWRFYLRRDPHWVGGGGDKLTRATSFVSGESWAQAMIAHVWSGAAPWQEHLVADPASGIDPRTGRVLTHRYNDFRNITWLGAARGPTRVFDAERAGRWMCVEAHVRLNDPGVENGVFELWVDGRAEARASDLNWVGRYEEFGINAVFLENYWNAGSPARQSRYVDDFVVSTKRVGCGERAD